MRVHFTAIGGPALYNLAIALYRKGYVITGSDDGLSEPALSRLASCGLLPEKPGWFPEKITPGIDVIIPGMNAKAGNPELIRAGELGIKIMSFPEFIYDQTKDKKSIVVAGSHGKTTITAMIIHVFKTLGIGFDYMVEPVTDSFEPTAGLSDNAAIAVIEGDEYPVSDFDTRPKFHLYMPDIAVINDIAPDHRNLFPAFVDYVAQFRIFAGNISEGGTLIYYSDDPEIKKIADAETRYIKKIPYRIHGYFRNKTGFYAATHNRTVRVKISGEHNMQSLSAAKEACLAAGVSEDDFYTAIGSFE